jgi:hypothetical protein
MSTKKLIVSPLLWLAFGLSLFTHFLYFTLDHKYYGADTPSYLIPADNLLSGHGFVNALHQPELLRTPGYPLILALFRIAPLKVEYLVLAQHLLCAFLSLGVAAFALKTTGSRIAALTVALALSLDLATIRIANLLLTEVLFTVLVSLTCWSAYLAISRPQAAMLRCVLTGILGGSAVLVRPVGVLYFVPLSICLWIGLQRSRSQLISLFVATFLMLPLLWTARNFSETGYLGISAIGTEDLLYYRAAGALAVRQPGGYLANAAKINLALIQQTCPELENRYHRGCSEITVTEQAAYASRKGIDIIRNHPFSYLCSMLISLLYVIFGGGAEALSVVTGFSPRMADLCILFLTIPELFLACIGCWYWYRRNQSLFYLLVFTIAYFLLISAGAEAYSRFKVPVMPMYALLIGGGVAEIAARIKRMQPSFSTN